MQFCVPRSVGFGAFRETCFVNGLIYENILIIGLYVDPFDCLFIGDVLREVLLVAFSFLLDESLGLDSLLDNRWHNALSAKI